jgi:hypothetical protein
VYGEPSKVEDREQGVRGARAHDDPHGRCRRSDVRGKAAVMCIEVGREPRGHGVRRRTDLDREASCGAEKRAGESGFQRLLGRRGPAKLRL